MKKLTSILLSLVLILSLCSVAMFTVGAEEETPAPSVWDGTANIKWYIDGKAAGMGEYELNSAADLAGLAYVVNASRSDARYNGVYYDANYKVLGYRLGSNAKYADLSMVYTPTAGDGSQVIDGDAFTWQNVKLNCDVVINEGNAADWATTPPTYNWQPIGGNIPGDANWCGFDGMFDGQGHTISGMYTTSAEDADLYGVGVFGIVGYYVNAGISNLIVENFYQECTYSASALIGRTKHAVVVENCVVRNGYVLSHKDQTAALIGGAYGGDATLVNCGVENVSIKGRDYIGGMVGTSVGYTVSATDSYFIGSINCEYQLGVIVGRKKEGNVNVKNVFAVAEGTEAATSANAATMGCGVVYGFAADASIVTVLAENYFYVQNLTAASGTVWDLDTEGATAVTLDHLKGETAKATLTGFDFDTVWKTVEGGTPVIELREDPNAGGEETEEPGNDETEEPGNNETNAPDNTETNAPETNAPETNAPNNTEKGGCGSSVGLAGIAFAAVLSGAAMMLRKKEN